MNRTLLKSVREYKKQSILTPLFVILEVFMEVLIPFKMADIIDVGIQGQNMEYILRVGLQLVVLAMLALFFGALAGKFGAEAGAGFAKKPASRYFLQGTGFLF